MIMKKVEVKIKENGLTMEIERDKFALALKTWRLRNGLTQIDAGRKLGCSRYTIMRAEAGKPITWTMAYRVFARLSKELIQEGAL